MATSPIYSWPEPDNTDLVKNGALAIRTLGNAIDTTMATMTPKSLVDAKGDLIAATANDTPARLAVGANGETLVADSSTATGLRYQGNFAAGKNKIINGDFGVWQRGTSFSITTAAFTVDRWACNRDGNGTYTLSQQTFTPGTAPVSGYEGTFFAQLACTSVGTSTYSEFVQPIEDVRTFAGQTITVSFWARISAGSLSNPYVRFNQIFGSGGSTQVTGSNLGFTPTSSWARYSMTTTLASISGKTIGTSSALSLQMVFPTGGATGTIQIWGVQVEAGSTATPFQTATGTIQGELAACQYYYNEIGGVSGTYLATGTCYSSAASILPLTFPIMRIAPSASVSAASDFASLNATGSSYTNTSVSFATLSRTTASVTATISSGFTSATPTIWTCGNANAKIKLSAEF